jgi:hypothetical protein
MGGGIGVQDKQTLIDSVRQGLESGIISAGDLRALLPEEAKQEGSTLAPVLPGAPLPAEEPEAQLPRQDTGKKLTLVDVLFYLAGGVLYASLMVMAFQAGSDAPTARTSIMLVSGLCLWALAFVLGRQEPQSENREGFVNAVLLTGCLAVISGGVLAASQTATDASADLGYALAVTFLLLGGLHLYFDRLFRRTVLVVFGMFLLVTSFPSFISALLSEQQLPMDVWTLIGMATGALMAGAGYVASHTAPGRDSLRDSFLSIAAFFTLASVYGASVSSDVAALWSIVLPLLIYGAFYMSIQRRSRNFLVTGSFFLVLFIITISFKYFSGFGAAFSLLVSATALLGTAFMASNINKRYIHSDS